MKKLLGIFALCLCLTGCGTVETFETLGEVQHEPVEAAVMGTVQLQLPADATGEVFSADNITLYECDRYTVTVQTVEAGDLDGTITALSGFRRDQLTVITTAAGENKCYEWVWTAAGEQGDLMCRAMVLDDGNYHYCLCTMALATDMLAVQESWNEVFSSFSLT